MADGQRHLSFNISETKYGTIHLATDIAITSKGLVDIGQKRNILPYPFNFQNLFCMFSFRKIKRQKRTDTSRSPSWKF